MFNAFSTTRLGVGASRRGYFPAGIVVGIAGYLTRM
jgi:hypothetical protein